MSGNDGAKVVTEKISTKPEEYKDYEVFGYLKKLDANNAFKTDDKPLRTDDKRFITLDDLPPMKKCIYLGSFPTTHMLGYACSFLVHLLIIIMTIIITIRCVKLGLQKTALHTYFCTLGLLCFFPIGMMISYSGNVMSFIFDSSTETIAHSVFLFIAAALGTYGAIHKFYFKPLHFETRHGRYGLVAIVLLTINMFVGAMTAIGQAINIFTSPLYYLIVHLSIGIFAFICMIISQMYGYDTGFFHRDIGHVKFFKICTIIVMVLALIGPFQDFIWLLMELLFKQKGVTAMDEQMRNP